MSLYRRGRIWWLELSTERGRTRRSTGTSDKKAAQEYHEKVKGEIWRQERLGEAPAVTWGEAVAKWLALQHRGLPDRYRLGKVGVDPRTHLPLTSEHLRRFLTTSTANTFNRNLSLVVAIHNASGVKAPSIQRRQTTPGRTRWLTSQEWDRLRAALSLESELLRQAAEFTLATGLRENNVLELTWDQINLSARHAWLHGDQMKAKRPLGVPLNDAACAILAQRRGIDRKWVFGNPDYPLTKASNRAWYAAVRKARLRGFRWHDLRHTWASWFVMNGGTLQELMALGGWASYQMVLRYSHLSSQHLREAAARVKPVSLRYNAPKRASQDTNSPTKGR